MLERLFDRLGLFVLRAVRSVIAHKRKPLHNSSTSFWCSHPGAERAKVAAIESVGKVPFDRAFPVFPLLVSIEYRAGFRMLHPGFSSLGTLTGLTKHRRVTTVGVFRASSSFQTRPRRDVRSDREKLPYCSGATSGELNSERVRPDQTKPLNTGLMIESRIPAVPNDSDFNVKPSMPRIMYADGDRWYLLLQKEIRKRTIQEYKQAVERAPKLECSCHFTLPSEQHAAIRRTLHCSFYPVKLLRRDSLPRNELGQHRKPIAPWVPHSSQPFRMLSWDTVDYGTGFSSIHQRVFHPSRWPVRSFGWSSSLSFVRFSFLFGVGVIDRVSE